MIPESIVLTKTCKTQLNSLLTLDVSQTVET